MNTLMGALNLRYTRPKLAIESVKDSRKIAQSMV